MRRWLIDPAQRSVERLDAETDYLKGDHLTILLEDGEMIAHNFEETKTDDYFVIEGCAAPLHGKAIFISPIDRELDWFISHVDFGKRVDVAGKYFFNGDFIFREIN